MTTPARTIALIEQRLADSDNIDLSQVTTDGLIEELSDRYKTDAQLKDLLDIVGESL